MTIDSIIGQLRASDSENSDIEDDQAPSLAETVAHPRSHDRKGSTRGETPTWSQGRVGRGVSAELTEMDSISSEAAHAYLRVLERQHERDRYSHEGDRLIDTDGGSRGEAEQKEQGLSIEIGKPREASAVDMLARSGVGDAVLYQDRALSPSRTDQTHEEFRQRQFGRGVGLRDLDETAREEGAMQAAGVFTDLERKEESKDILERRVRFESGISASGELCTTAVWICEYARRGAHIHTQGTHTHIAKEQVDKRHHKHAFSILLH